MTENNKEFKLAYDVWAKTLQEDAGLFLSYQSNIAMMFVDEVENKGYRFPDLHKIANAAAIKFLKLAISKVGEQE